MLFSQTVTRQYDITARDAVRLQREVQSGNPDLDLEIQNFETATSKVEPENVRTLEKTSVKMHYFRPVKKPTFLSGRIPPWFQMVKEDLHKDKSTFVKPLPSKVKLGTQRPARYDEQLLRSRDFKSGLTTLLLKGKKVLQKTRIALFIDSTMKATSNLNKTLMDVRVRNLPCSSFSDMPEVTCKVFGPTANPTETIPSPALLIYSNVIDQLVLRRTLRYLEGGNRRLTEEVMTSEILSYIEAMRSVILRVQRKKPTVRINLCITPRIRILSKASATISVLALGSCFFPESVFLYCGSKFEDQCYALAPLRKLISRIAGGDIERPAGLHRI